MAANTEYFDDRFNKSAQYSDHGGGETFSRKARVLIAIRFVSFCNHCRKANNIGGRDVCAALRLFSVHPLFFVYGGAEGWPPGGGQRAIGNERTH